MKTRSSGTAYARAGLLGNPSDGYFGRTIAVSIKNFHARVELKENPELVIKTSEEDRLVYPHLSSLVEDINAYGYYGGVRLIKAALKKFYEHSVKKKIDLGVQNFAVCYHSNIPRQLGLGGSSAIITAALRALMGFYGFDIPLKKLPSMILEAEREELGINAGFMDRVIQVYEGCVYMDLNKKIIESQGHGVYQKMDPRLLPSLYLAFNPNLGKVSGEVLNDIRMNYDKGDPFTIDTLNQIAEKAEKGKDAIEKKDYAFLRKLMDENFDLRSQIMRISQPNREMIDTARRCGASAKFAGSGGAIIGMYEKEEIFQNLKQELGEIRVKVIKPLIA